MQQVSSPNLTKKEGRGRGRLQAGGGEAQRRRGPTLSNEIRATLVDHVVNHGLTLRAAGLRVQPNLSRFTVASVIRAFRLENRYKNYLFTASYCMHPISALLIPLPVTFYSRLHVFCST